MFTWGGDATLHGKINIVDSGIIGGNISREGPRFAKSHQSGAAAVPEPGGLAISFISAG